MSLDFEPVIESWQLLAGGLLQTLALSGLTIVLSVILGSAIGLSRCYGPKWLSLPLVF